MDEDQQDQECSTTHIDNIREGAGDEDDEHAFSNKVNATANQPMTHKEKSLQLLSQFLDSYPDVPRVSVVKELSEEHRREYNNWKAAMYRRDPKYRQKQIEYKRMLNKDPEHRRSEAERINCYRRSEEGVLTFYINSTRQFATKKGVPFEVTREMVLQTIGSACYYCGEILKSPGVDSVDAEKGFVEGNIQPCCKFCNRAKWKHHWQDFIRIMCNVGASSSDTTWTPNYVFVNEKTQRGSGDYNQYRISAKARKLRFELSKSDFQTLVSQRCHYCGGRGKYGNVGIDRVDSKGHYTCDNVVPCCSMCNVMKRDNSAEFFTSKAVSILRIWGSTASQWF